MSPLLALPHEVLHGVLKEVERQDLSPLCRSCRSLNNFIKGNDLLWKEHYLREWDEPAEAQNYDWASRLRDITRLQRILESTDVAIKEVDIEFVERVISDFLKSPPPDSMRHAKFLAQFFEGLEDNINVSCLLTKSSLYSDNHRIERERGFSPPASVNQLSAKLHCLYGVPISESPTPHRFQLSGLSKKLPTHAYARSRVYDIRNYTTATEWAPLAEDGSGAVDWEKMEAIMIVLDYNMQLNGVRDGDIGGTDEEFLSVWTRPFEGVEPRDMSGEDSDESENNEHEDDTEEDVNLQSNSVPISKDVDLALENFDPYDVTGCWLRVVCFLDYSDFYAFNFSERPPPSQARLPIRTGEALRLITITLTVTRIEPVLEKGALPIVHFEGLSKLVDSHWDVDASSRIRGSVRLTKEGEVRWQTISIFHGNEERWRSEGIQVGGLRSRRPILGTWFDKDYDGHGPLGPTAFWKIHTAGTY